MWGDALINMLPQAPVISIDSASFWVGFITSTSIWWIILKIYPLFKQIRQDQRERRLTAPIRRISEIEEIHRRTTFLEAQGMHLAASLFPLDKIVLQPRLMVPPPSLVTGNQQFIEDLISRTIPYLPNWPELAAIYNSPSLTIPQALSGGVHLVIVGQPGIGKTVALAHLATLATKKEEALCELSESIPFLFHIADLNLPLINSNDTLTPIITYVEECLPISYQSRVPDYVRHTFRNGNVLLLLDGLDELPPENINIGVEFLQQLLKTYPKIRIVTTGCPEQLCSLIGLGFIPLSLFPWGPSQRNDFLEKWGGQWKHISGEDVYAKTGLVQENSLLLSKWLMTDSRIYSPFELTLKAWGAYAGDLLGPNSIDVIETHLHRISPNEIPLTAIETLAMNVTLATSPIFDARKARNWVKLFELPEEKPVEDFEEKLDKNHKEKFVPIPRLLSKMVYSGLLLSYRNNNHRFCHPIFGGYLAGRALAGYNAISHLLDQPAWSGKILAMHYLSVFGDATPLVDMLLQKPDTVLERNLFMVARWLRDIPHQAKWYSQVLNNLMNLLRSEGQPLGLIGQAVVALILSEDLGTTTLFRQFMKSTSCDLVRLVALGSGAIKDIKATDQLVGLFQIPNIYTRCAACLALVSIGDTSALETVATLLLHGDDYSRRAAAEALANHPKEGHAILKDGAIMEDMLVRHSVVYGLARIDQTWAVEILEKMQAEDDQWNVRNSAGEMLNRKHQMNPHIPRPLPPPYESTWLVEFASAQGIGISPGASVTDILLLALKSEDEDIRMAALPYIRHSPTEDVIAAIYQALYGNDVEFREAAYNTIREIADSGISLPAPHEAGIGV